MKRNDNFADPAPGTGVYEGDLKYGRAFGTEPRSQKDYPADRRVADGSVVNAAIFKLPMVSKRAPEVWGKKAIDPKTGKPPKNNGNPPQIVDMLLYQAVENPYGLIDNVSLLRLGRTIVR